MAEGTVLKPVSEFTPAADQRRVDKRTGSMGFVENSRRERRFPSACVRDVIIGIGSGSLTVFVISSINRSNYLTPIDFESLKESGGIEYTADVIWGLQLQCLNDPLFSEVNKIKEKRKRIRQEKSENPRKIELQCLKNRYGTANFSCCFDYYPRNDLFLQSSHEEFIQCDNNENPFEDTNPSNSSKHKRF